MYFWQVIEKGNYVTQLQTSARWPLYVYTTMTRNVNAQTLQSERDRRGRRLRGRGRRRRAYMYAVNPKTVTLHSLWLSFSRRFVPLRLLSCRYLELSMNVFGASDFGSDRLPCLGRFRCDSLGRSVALELDFRNLEGLSRFASDRFFVIFCTWSFSVSRDWSPMLAL